MKLTDKVEKEDFLKKLCNLFEHNHYKDLTKDEIMTQIEQQLTNFEHHLALKLCKRMVHANIPIWTVQFVTELERKQVKPLYNMDDMDYPAKIKGYIDDILSEWEGKGARYLRDKYSSKVMSEKDLNRLIYHRLEDRELFLSDRISSYMGAYEEGWNQGYGEGLINQEKKNDSNEN